MSARRIKRNTLYGFCRLRIVTSRDNPCWVWTGGRDSQGYGRTYFEGKTHQAHRVTFYLKHGRWPAEGMVLDHLCDTKPCVNPEHLAERTQSENIMRCTPRGDERTERRREQWRRAQQRRRAQLAGIQAWEDEMYNEAMRVAL